MSHVIDASALLAYVTGEDGAAVVETALAHTAHCSAANWSEVSQKILTSGRDWQLVKALLLSTDLRIEPVQMIDAEWAARRWRRGDGLSLADRLCLALADRLALPVLTADSAWGSTEMIRQIR
ncbi:MAG: PIN domain-containing protein [Actinobacteria bacterium]|nr:PIN domain-containing protein [Actinomycetota bacterium]MCB9390248.1 PIN domain-containing protein [Acidimicrobiia bacterium]